MAVEAFHLGVNDYFTKDYTLMYFQRIINSINQGIGGYWKQLKREQMQDSLIESEERYRSMLDNAHDAIIFAKADGGIPVGIRQFTLFQHPA